MIIIFPILTSLVAWLIAQLLKPLLIFLETGIFDIRQTMASGGFPSSHSATVTALTSSIFIVDGLSTTFAIALVISFIVIYDAINVRYYAGKNIQITKQIIQDLKEHKVVDLDNPIYQEKIKTVLGHKLFEAIGGIFFGILTTLITYIFVL